MSILNCVNGSFLLLLNFFWLSWCLIYDIFHTPAISHSSLTISPFCYFSFQIEGSLHTFRILFRFVLETEWFEISLICFLIQYFVLAFILSFFFNLGRKLYIIIEKYIFYIITPRCELHRALPSLFEYGFLFYPTFHPIQSLRRHSVVLRWTIMLIEP